MMALSPPHHRRSPPPHHRRSPPPSRGRSRSVSRSISTSRSRSRSRSDSPIVRRKSSPRTRSPSPRSKRLRKAPKETPATGTTSSSPPRRIRRHRSSSPSASPSPSPSPPPAAALQRSSSQRQAHRHHHQHHHHRVKGDDSPPRNGAEGRHHHSMMEEEGHSRGRRGGGGGSPPPSRRGISPSSKRGGDRDLDVGHRRGREKGMMEPRSAVPTSGGGGGGPSAGVAASSHGATFRAEVKELGGSDQRSGSGRGNAASSVSGPEGDRPFRSGNAREISGGEPEPAMDSISRMEAAASALENAEKEKAKPSFELSGKLAAETNKFRGVTLLFSEPPEARKPLIRWRLYVFKEGEPFKDPLYIHRQSCYLFGRERRVADVPTDHPSCSKQHAVIQYRLVEKDEADGTTSSKVRPYVMDLGSTNGTYLNGERIEAQRYYELFEKDTIKFGNSSREYVLLHENSAG